MTRSQEFEKYYFNKYAFKFNFMTYKFNFRTVHRGRPFIEKKAESIISQVRTLKDVWAPPKHLAKKNRCNDVGDSLLYVSTHISTIPFELEINPNDLFISCAFNQVRDFTFIPIVGWNQLMKVNERGLSNIIGNYFNDKSEDVQFIDNELSKLFTSKRVSYMNDDLYDHTIGLTRLYFKNGGDGLMYPSVANGFNSVNLVLKPDQVKSKLKPEKCNLFRLIEKNHNSIKVESLMEGTFNSIGDIHWTPTSINRFIQFEK